MKAQFKYAFLTGLYSRGIVFSVIFIMNAVFITLGSMGALPIAAKITAVSLGGVAIAVMLAINIISDVFISRRLLSFPDAYLYLLTPVPRWKTLLAGVITMMAMDLITMTVVIFGEVWLSFNLTGLGNIWNLIAIGVMQNPTTLMYIFWGLLTLVAGYLLVMMIILFCATARKSIFFKIPASGLLAFLLACACVYVINALQIVLVPFGSIQRIWGIFFEISLGGSAACAAFCLLTLIEAAVLFVITSKLMERRMNI